jgi:L-rhamnose mutarotase
MRLYNEAEDNIKEVTIENYSVFRNLFKSKYLFYLLIAYTV